MSYSWPRLHFNLALEPLDWFLASILAPQLFDAALGQREVVFQTVSWLRKAHISRYMNISPSAFSYIFLLSMIIHSKKLILVQFFWTTWSRNSTEWFKLTPRKGAVHRVYSSQFGVWFACKRPNFNFFASYWEIARWNLPQACTLLQPLINLNNHLLLHILPSKRDYALIISSRAFEGCRTKANRLPVNIISKIKIKTSVFSAVVL